MKKLIAPLILALLAACPLAGFSQTNLQQDPAYLPVDKLIDLETIRPAVNLNLPRFLLKDALSGLTNSTARGEADLVDLIKDIKLIRVVVIEANQTNRPALAEAMKKLRHEVEKKWTAIVDVNDDNDKVGIYVMSDPAGEATAGVALLICDSDDLIIGNIVGNVSIAKLMKIASQSNKLPKDLLKKLQGFGIQTKQPSATTSGGSSSSGSSTNAASTDPKTPAEGSSGK